MRISASGTSARDTDAAYVALAEVLPATLLTSDTRLARATLTAEIEVLG